MEQLGFTIDDWILDISTLSFDSVFLYALVLVQVNLVQFAPSHLSPLFVLLHSISPDLAKFLQNPLLILSDAFLVQFVSVFV